MGCSETHRVSSGMTRGFWKTWGWYVFSKNPPIDTTWTTHLLSHDVQHDAGWPDIIGQTDSLVYGPGSSSRDLVWTHK